MTREKPQKISEVAGICLAGRLRQLPLGGEIHQPRAGGSREIAFGYFSLACEGRFQVGCVNLLDREPLRRANPRRDDLWLLLSEGGRKLEGRIANPELFMRACNHGWTYACDRGAQ